MTIKAGASSAGRDLFPGQACCQKPPQFERRKLKTPPKPVGAAAFRKEDNELARTNDNVLFFLRAAHFNKKFIPPNQQLEPPRPTVYNGASQMA